MAVLVGLCHPCGTSSRAASRFSDSRACVSVSRLRGHRVCSRSGFEGSRLPLFQTPRAIYGRSYISRRPRTRLWAVSRAPLIPVALTTGPFSLEDARRHGLTKDHLLSASWQRLGGGFYALRAIADDPNVALAALSRRLPTTAVFSGRTASWLHGLDLHPCDPVEVTLPSRCHVAAGPEHPDTDQ